MKFYLVDASGFLFRAYHAFPELRNSDGENINMVYGFFRILLKLFMEKPDCLVLVWDLPIPTERHKIDTDYKANRPESPEDFKKQIPIIQKIVNELEIPSAGYPGYEADDIIATLSKQFGHSDNQIIIISSDKDLKQLLNENTVIQDPIKYTTSTFQSFVKEFGFVPELMLDYLSLIGDSADNIKGVPGVGPKTALKLIQKYSTLEKIYEKISEIDSSTQKKLLDGKESAFHSKRLIKLLDVPDYDKIQMDNYRLKINISKYYQTLVNNYHFDSMVKPLEELKKNLLMPTQSSLF